MEKKDNVIDLTSRIQNDGFTARLKNLKVRFDLEHARVAVPASLLSIVLLVTLANTTIMSQPKVSSTDLASVSTRTGRAIASVSTGTSLVEDQLVKRLAKSELSESATIGRRPSSLENLTLGSLEGKYAIRLQDGKIREIEFASGNSDGDRPKHIENLAAFLKDNAELLPYKFEKAVKVQTEQDGSSTTETYHLLNGISIPVAKVEFDLDAAGRLLAMHVAQVQLAAK
jgi:hypothetical protein